MRAISDVKSPKRRAIVQIALAVVALFAWTAFDATAQVAITSKSSIGGTVRIFERDGKEKVDQSGVVVFIDGLPEYSNSNSSRQPPQVTHKNRQFAPRVLPLARGDTVDFFNDDNIFHNVFSLSRPKTFDLGIYPEGTSRLVTFSEPGLVKIHCNIHPDMTSTILVLNNDLFSVTGTNGEFRIDNVPVGSVTLRVWSEFSEEQSRVVSLGGGGKLDELFEVHETKRFVQHRNKFGKRYREKY